MGALQPRCSDMMCMSRIVLSICHHMSSRCITDKMINKYLGMRLERYSILIRNAAVSTSPALTCSPLQGYNADIITQSGCSRCQAPFGLARLSTSSTSLHLSARLSNASHFRLTWPSILQVNH